MSFGADTASEENVSSRNDEQYIALHKEILEYLPSNRSMQQPHLIEQRELNDLNRILNLPVRKAEISGPRLQE